VARVSQRPPYNAGVTTSPIHKKAFSFAPHLAKPGSLAFALLGAANLLHGVAQGQSLQSTLPALTQAWQLSAADRGAIQAITFHTLRRWARAKALRELLLPKPKPALLGSLLEVCLALTEPKDAPLYPQHTLVSQAVEAAKACRELQATQGVVNAVLRRWQREQAQLKASLQKHAQAEALAYNLPQWWMDRLKSTYSTQYKDICAELLAQPPMTLRVYTRKTPKQAYLQELQQAGIGAYALAGDALVLLQAQAVDKLPRFDEGACSVQDFGAQLAAHLLNAQAGMRVLDACAAPGGKTAHVLELAEVQMTALDSDALRLQRVAQTLQRTGLHAKLIHADAAQPNVWWDGVAFDRILLDAPCSASGIVRRHPDIAWLRRESDITSLAQTQAALLQALWRTLKVGGRLLYCTCSVFPQEGEQQTTAFLAKTPNARVIDVDLSLLGSNLGHNLPEQITSVLRLEHGVQLLPCGFTQAAVDTPPLEPVSTRARITHDGFYYALLEKTD
jgi:16S rRNA (cytosine967-C5)-methyltransferase